MTHLEHRPKHNPEATFAIYCGFGLTAKGLRNDRDFDLCFVYVA